MPSLGAPSEAAFPDPGRRRPAPGPAARLCRRLRTCRPRGPRPRTASDQCHEAGTCEAGVCSNHR